MYRLGIYLANGNHAAFRFPSPDLRIELNVFDSSSNFSHAIPSFIYVCTHVFDFADFVKCLEYRDGKYGFNSSQRFRIFETLY